MIARSDSLFPIPDDERLADMPLLDFFDQIYAVEVLAGGSPRTKNEYRVQISQLAQGLARKLALQHPPLTEEALAARRLLLSDVNDHLLASTISWQLEQGRSPATCNKLRRTVLALWRYATDEKGFPGKRLRVKALRTAKRKPQAWTIDEFNRILAAAAQVRGKVGTIPACRWWPALLLVLFNTGCRISAVMHCPTRGLNLERGILRVPAEVQKHDADEVFDLLPITVQALEAIDAGPARIERLGDDWPHDRTQNHWRALTYQYRKILVIAGLFDTRKSVTSKDLFHKLRRTFGSYVAARLGKSAAQEALGHSSQAVTQLYLDREIVGGPKLRDILPAPEVKLPLRVRRFD